MTDTANTLKRAVSPLLMLSLETSRRTGTEQWLITEILPAPSPEQGLNRYLQEIRKFPMLEPDEEYMLAKRWVEDQDTEAAHKMVYFAPSPRGEDRHGLSRLRVAAGRSDLGSQRGPDAGRLKRFDPEKGFRLATYAMWWIRASIQEYILRSWSLVKLGTTSGQKKLFFNLRKAKARIGGAPRGGRPPGPNTSRRSPTTSTSPSRRWCR